MGGPWEILRSTTTTKDERLVEYYCKAGNLNSYNNILCLVPDYGIVITVLSAGPESDAQLVDEALSLVVKGLMPAIEDAGKTEAAPVFAGSYVDEESKSAIKLATDDGPGFAVSDWTVRGIPVLAMLRQLRSDPELVVNIRLYPTNLSNGKQVAWRANFDYNSPEELQAYDDKMFWPEASCHTWASFDRFVYTFKSIDEFIFDFNDDGSISSITNRGFQLKMSKAA
jgi:hypothetical protein